MTRTLKQLVLAGLRMLAACAPSPESTPTPEAPLMVTAPAGMFLMGSDSGPASSRPAHWVCLGTYEIDATEVTASAIAA